MLIAFNGDPKLKADLINEVHKHRVADRLLHGTYGESGNGFHGGCAVGCSIESYRKLSGKKLQRNDHRNYEEFGIPRLLAKLEDGIFEGLPREYAQEWPEKFFQAIQPGADLSGVWSQFAQWLMVDPAWGVIKHVKDKAGKKAIQHVADLYAMGSKATAEEFKAAARACRELRAAAYADADAAAYAAYDAAAYAADAYAAAADKARTAQANKLMELLHAAPVPKREAV